MPPTERPTQSPVDRKSVPKTGSSLPATHRVVRRQHRNERTEDYVEAIYRLKEDGEKVRIVSLQSIFGVSHVTVIRALERLEQEGLIRRGKEGIELREKGRLLAISCYERHRTVEKFLRRLGVSKESARRDAEGIEHHLGEETLRAMENFIADQEPGGSTHSAGG